MQHANETAAEYIRRIMSWLDRENELLLDDLPSIDALVEFFELWSKYDTDFWDGICECIAEGDDPAQARAFLRKYKLNWELPQRGKVSK
jgi:hypothetical protein